MYLSLKCYRYCCLVGFWVLNYVFYEFHTKCLLGLYLLRCICELSYTNLYSYMYLWCMFTTCTRMQSGIKLARISFRFFSFFFLQFLSILFIVWAKKFVSLVYGIYSFFLATKEIFIMKMFF